MAMKACHQCGTAIVDHPGFRESCPSCHAYLHCCLNCRLYSPSAHNHCLSPTTEFVSDVAQANFCEEFTFKDETQGLPNAKNARQKFDELFG
jgi:hypothetical protein